MRNKPPELLRLGVWAGLVGAVSNTLVTVFNRPAGGSTHGGRKADHLRSLMGHREGLTGRHALPEEDAGSTKEWRIRFLYDDTATNRRAEVAAPGMGDG